MSATTGATRYCIDSNSIFTLWKRAYPQRRFPSLWKQIDGLIEQGRLISPIDVYNELLDPDIAEWARARRERVFRELDAPVQQWARHVMTKAPRLIDPNSLKSNADPFLIAMACAERCVVVTEEGMTGDNAKKINIPNACKAMGILCVNALGMLDREGWTF